MNPSLYAFADEFYIVDKTVELVVTIGGESKTIRIEVLFNPKCSKYHSRAYLRESYHIQPTDPQTNEQFDRPPADKQIWVDFELPWTDRDSADGALSQAIGFLRDRCD